MTTKKRYRVVVRDFSCWPPRPILEDCGHKHRSIRTAVLCLEKLYDYNPRTRCHSAVWHHAEVEGIGFDVDADELSSVEADIFIGGNR